MNFVLESVHQIGCMMLRICYGLSTYNLHVIFQASVKGRHIISFIILRRETNWLAGEAQTYLVFWNISEIGKCTLLVSQQHP